MVGGNQDVGRIQNAFQFERLYDSGEIIIRVTNGLQTLRRARAGLMLGKVGLIHPEERKCRHPISPERVKKRGSGPVITGWAFGSLLWERAILVRDDLQ